MQCFNCFTPLSADDKFCRSCGKSVEEMMTEIETNYCTGCGKQVDDKWENCPFCGKKIQKATEIIFDDENPSNQNVKLQPRKIELQADGGMICENCGANIKPEAKFCNKCGAPLTNTLNNAQRNEIGELNRGRFEDKKQDGVQRETRYNSHSQEAEKSPKKVKGEVIALIEIIAAAAFLFLWYMDFLPFLPKSAMPFIGSGNGCETAASQNEETLNNEYQEQPNTMITGKAAYFPI